MAAVVMAVLGGVLVAVGCGLAWLPAGVVVAGAELMAAGYVMAYMRARAGGER